MITILKKVLCDRKKEKQLSITLERCNSDILFGRYTYRVTNVFAVSRDEATRNYVDNFSIGSDKCYIITCGRDDGVKNYRYLDLIVEGTLEEQMPLLEYAKIRQQSEANK